MVPAGAEMTALQPKLSALASESYVRKEAATTTFTWRGRDYIIKQDRVHGHVSTAQEVQRQLSAAMDTDVQVGCRLQCWAWRQKQGFWDIIGIVGVCGATKGLI